MNKIILSATLLLSGCAGFEKSVHDVLEVAKTQGIPTTGESIMATREALQKGILTGVADLNKDGGFNQSAHRILVPQDLAKAAQMARTLGLSSQVDAFEKSLNRAAEQAVGAAVPIFKDSITQLTFTDIVTILQGSDQAATQYFRSKSENKLIETFKPIVAQATAKNDVAKIYRQLMTAVKPAAMIAGIAVPSVDLDEYVSQQAVEALFQEIGHQEQLVRKNPVERSTALLQKVFGYYSAGLSRPS